MVSKPSNIPQQQIVNKVAYQVINPIGCQYQQYQQYIILDPQQLGTELRPLIINSTENNTALPEIFVQIGTHRW